jgi:DNA invertase Pin-like site-specific DNA recombinase
MGRRRQFKSPEIARTLSHTFQRLRSPNRDEEMPLNEIRSVANQIAERRIPLQALAESLGIRTTTLYRWFNDVGIKLVTPPGRPPNPDIPLI